MARPAVAVRLVDARQIEGIAMDVPDSSKQMRITRDHAGMEAPAEQRPIAVRVDR